MTIPVLSKTRIREGVWEGVLQGAPDQPEITVLCNGAPVADVRATLLSNTRDTWEIAVPIPVTALSEGAQTFVFLSGPESTVLGHFTLIVGAEDEDLRAEIALLRAELDLLKRAFRRHCAEASR